MAGQGMPRWLVRSAGVLFATMLPLVTFAQARQAATPPPTSTTTTQTIQQVVQKAVQQALAQQGAQAGQANPDGINLRGGNGSQVQIQFTPEQIDQITQTALAATRRSVPVALAGTLFVPLAFFATIVLMAYFVSRRRGAQIRTQAELRKQLIDKFGSAQELAVFLESKGGQQFFQDLRQPPSPLRFLRGGIVITMIGLAILGLTPIHRDYLDTGVIILATGIGLLLSGAIGHKLMPKQGADAGTRGGDPGTGIPSLPRA